MTPYRCQDWAGILRLLRAEFAYIEGRIEPPSSLARLTEAAIADQADTAEIWAIGAPPLACVFLTPKTGSLYIGKLAVSAQHRRNGLARTLIGLAETRARVLHLPALELQTRVELSETQATWLALGFREIDRTAHPGFTRPTSITYRKDLP